MPLIFGGTAPVPAAHSIDNSCRFNTADSATLTKTISAGNRTTWTISFWIKRSSFAEYGPFSQWDSTSTYTRIRFKDSTNVVGFNDVISTSSIMTFATDATYYDPAAWYHMVLAVDTTQATDTNRMKFYVNGELQTFASQTYPTQDVDTNIGTVGQTLGVGTDADLSFVGGYMAEVVFIDGTQYAASDFGEFNEDSPTIWVPKRVSGLTFGTNGFYLDFKDSANLGNDANGGTDLTENNITAVDQCTDTPSNNFCVMNNLDNFYYGGAFSEGNCRVAQAAQYTWCTSTFGMSKGKWYWECLLNDRSALEQGFTDRVSPSATTQAISTANTLAYQQNAVIYWNASTYASDWTTVSDDDILMFALDLTNNKAYVGVNGTWEDSGDPTSGATGTGAISITAIGSTLNGAYFVSQGDGGGAGANISYNFGNPPYTIASGNADADGYGNFEYAVPSGYYALCTKNLGAYGG